MKCEEEPSRGGTIHRGSEIMSTSSSHLLGSSSSSSSSCSSSSGGILKHNSLGGKKYPIKTLCFNRKLLSMPSKDEYSVLLCNGLGARKWVVSFELDADGFKRAILKIYPLLSTVFGYTLWTINKDKELEKLPPKVNTPKRISAYFGMHFSGCLIIMPSESIYLISSETLHPEILCSDRQPEISISDGINTCRQIRTKESYRNKKHYRQICCLCGKTAKSIDEATSGFYDINSHTLTPDDRSVPISSSLKSILNIDLNKINDFSNDNICKKCYHQLLDINYLQSQLKSKKEEMVSNFFHTMARSIKLSHPPSVQGRSWTAFLSNEEDSTALGTATVTTNCFYSSSGRNPKREEEEYEDMRKPRSLEALDSPNEESFNNHSSSLSPNSSPSPPRSGGGCSGGSSDSSTGSTIRHSWKKRYCEMNQSTSYLHKMESSEPSNKKKRMNTQFISDEDSGVNSSAASSALLDKNE